MGATALQLVECGDAEVGLEVAKVALQELVKEGAVVTSRNHQHPLARHLVYLNDAVVSCT